MAASPRPESSARWRPLLQGAEARQALAVARAIAGTRLAAAHGSLGSGAAGLALWLAYARRCRVSRAGRRQASLLAQADASLESDPLPPGLHSGFTGIAWTHAHLDRLHGDPGATDLAAIDNALIDALSAEWTRDYDLIEGLVGIGVYALERRPSDAGARLLDLVVAQLRSHAIRDAAGVAWFTASHLVPEPPAGTPRLGHYNLGVAHGIPGVIGLLGAAAAAGHEPAMALLADAVPWFLAQERPAGADGGFAAWRHESESSPAAARLAWCYGDAGIAGALMVAALGARREDWQQHARRLATQAARRTVESSGVTDAMVCHGSAGVAHVFNRLWQVTGEASLADAARLWIARTIRFQRPGAGIGGYESWALNAQGQTGWCSDPGVLTGSAGVGLVLLAAATNVEPEWDRALLLSCRHGADVSA